MLFRKKKRRNVLEEGGSETPPVEGEQGFKQDGQRRPHWEGNV